MQITKPRATQGKTRLWARCLVSILATLAGLAALAALVTTPAMGGDRTDGSGKIQISTLSNRPDKLSGDDVLVAVEVPQAAELRDVTVKLNGSDVTVAFAPEPGTHRLLGLVKGLRLGKNELTASARRVGSARQQLVNHPITGPVFSGPQQKPFYCQTHEFRVYPGGPFLTPSQIAPPCEVPTRIDYLYRTAAGAFAALNQNNPLPADLGYTTTTTGATVPYIVRLETGTINRSVYQTAVLDDPRVAGPDLRTRTDPGWNGRLVHNFGGGCQPGWYVQGASALFNVPGAGDPHLFLSKGFAVSSASFTVLGNNCNFVLAAETMMMVKEHFIETYGVPLYTMGWGCSGGSILQNMIADAYPGLLDGIVPQCSFADITNIHGLDSRVLYNYYVNGGAGVKWTEDEIVKVSGFHNFAHIKDHGVGRASRYDPLRNRPGFPPDSSGIYPAAVPHDVRYDPVSNPRGVRATLWDSMANIFGRDARGFGRPALDNVGIQYGLAALNAGQISMAQFLDLNQKIGGMDSDGNFTTRRTVADPKGIKAAYETGFFNVGGRGLGSVAILDIDLIYRDQTLTGDPHLKFQHFATRERIRNTQGRDHNMVIWSGATTPQTWVQALLQMDAWLSNLAADKSSAPLAAKVVKSKPASLQDGCWNGATFIPEPQFQGGTGTSACNTLYPSWTFPRFVAGAPLAHDVVQCQRRPVNVRDYPVAPDAAEVTRLRSIFADGVCDYARRGINQPDLLDTWLVYTGDGKYHKDRHPREINAP